MPPSQTKSATPSPLRARKESDGGRTVTSERIAADLAMFRKAGGRIEVLGVTQMLKRVETPAPAAASTTRRRGSDR